MRNKIMTELISADELMKELNFLYNNKINTVFDELLNIRYRLNNKKLSKAQMKILNDLNIKILREYNLAKSEILTLEAEKKRMEFNSKNVMDIFNEIEDEYENYKDPEKWLQLSSRIKDFYEEIKKKEEKENE